MAQVLVADPDLGGELFESAVAPTGFEQGDDLIDGEIVGHFVSVLLGRRSHRSDEGILRLET